MVIEASRYILSVVKATPLNETLLKQIRGDGHQFS